MDVSAVPEIWQAAFRRDREGKSSLSDPLPERRQARLLAAFLAAGLVFMILPGTVLGVWNLVGITSQRAMAGVSAAWIQAHGHAQLFGWVWSFIIGISLYALPKFQGFAVRSIPAGWLVWAMWTAGVGMRWLAGIQTAVHPAQFRLSAACELSAGLLTIWLCAPAGAKQWKRDPWVAPVLGGFAVMIVMLAWQLYIVTQPLAAPALPLETDRTFVSLAIWSFSLPVVIGYSAKFFPGLLGTAPAHKTGLRVGLVFLLAASAGFLADTEIVAASSVCGAVALACWSLRVFQKRSGNPKTSGVYAGYPSFARAAYGWLAVSAVLTFFSSRPGMLGASRHAFTVGFLATLIFAIGPRILPAFANSRELWSPRLMRLALILITAGCALRVVSEPLAYGGIVAAAWKVLPISAFTELAAVLVFGTNLAMTLATPIPSWFGRAQVNDRMSVYWLVSAYPGTRKVLLQCGLATLARAKTVPKTLTVREAAEADGVPAQKVVDALGGFFESRKARSAR